MTLEERKAAATKETEELLYLYNVEIDKVTAELEQTGKFKMGLDANSEAYAAVNKEFDKRMAAVFKKYGLPPGTKLKLW